MLQPSWDVFNFTLVSSHIRVFRKDGNELMPLADKDPGAPLHTDHAYFAVEYFQTIPTDMYRTMRIDQLQPCTYSHPDYLNEERRWTCMSPLYCAAMNSSEAELPWYAVSKQGNLVVHGASLCCKDEAQESDIVDPFRAVEENEETGVTRLTMEQYEGLVNDRGGKLHPVFGILQTNVSHQMTPFERELPKDMPKRKEKGSKKKRMTSERLVCFRYKLRKGTDLSKYGMALVYDNSSRYNCSLIREKSPEPTKSRKWGCHEFLHESVPVLPVDYSPEDVGSADSDERDELLRTKILCPFAEFVGSADYEEPERWFACIAGKQYLAFPKVAALFVLHDLYMKASAEPVALERFDNPLQQPMFWAASVLYHIDADDDVRKAIEELEESAYHVSDVDSSYLLTLRSAMQTAVAMMDHDDWKKLELDEDASTEALEDGIYIIDAFV
jgi:hypothetical protein